MRETFRRLKLSKSNKLRLDQINSIVREYQRQGYKLTLRQLYYQLVSRDVIPNKVAEYAKLSILLKEGRMAGIVDWDAIEDRLRVPYTPASFDSPADIMEAVINQYKMPRMKDQENYLEVWVEKDALSGVLKRVTSKYHVPILVNRGYSSASAMYDSYGRFREALSNGQKIKILYLGDFDPSGMDMIRDVRDRPLEMLTAQASDFITDVYDEWVKKEFDGDGHDAADSLRDDYGDVDEYPQAFSLYDEEDKGSLEFDELRAFIISRFEVIPIALTRKQITQYKPPPNPAKKTDPRSKKFIGEHGGQSWEVDALKPEVLNQLLDDAIVLRIDLEKYNNILQEEKVGKAKLSTLKKKLIDDDVEADEDFDNKEEDEDD